MPYTLLKKLTHTRLPFEIKAESEINKLLALNAAGFVQCQLPDVVQTLEGPRFSGSAVVTGVTAEGLLILHKRKLHPHRNSR